jgi:hypothetical protein
MEVGWIHLVQCKGQWRTREYGTEPSRSREIINSVLTCSRHFAMAGSDPVLCHTGRKTSLWQMCPLCTWKVRYGGALGREVCMHSTISVLHGLKSQASRSTLCVCPWVDLDMVARRKFPDCCGIRPRCQGHTFQSGYLEDRDGAGRIILTRILDKKIDIT